MSSDREASSFHTKRYLQKSGRLSKVWNDDSELDSRSQDDFIGSIRQTDMQMRDSKYSHRQSEQQKQGYATLASQDGRITAVMHGSYRDANGNLFNSDANKASTVNKSDSDEEMQFNKALGPSPDRE